MVFMMTAQRQEAWDSKLHVVSGELLVQAPSDFSASLAFIRGFGPTSGEQRLSCSSVARAMLLDGRPVVFELSQTDHPERLAYRLHSAAPLSFDARVRILRRVRFQFGLDDDLVPFYLLADGDRAFSRVVSQLYGMHHVKFPSAFEIACWAILMQRVPMAHARQMKRALVERFGASLEVGGHAHWAFPDAGRVADAGLAAIHDVVGHPKKAAAIDTLSRAFAADGIDEFLRAAPYDEAEAWLRALPMIGEFSANFILFRGLGRMNRFAAQSGELVDAVRRVYPAYSMSDHEALALGERYGEWRGYWALYLRASAFVNAVPLSVP